jgi:hypothetical protein
MSLCEQIYKLKNGVKITHSLRNAIDNILPSKERIDLNSVRRFLNLKRIKIITRNSPVTNISRTIHYNKNGKSIQLYSTKYMPGYDFVNITNPILLNEDQSNMLDDIIKTYYIKLRPKTSKRKSSSLSRKNITQINKQHKNK